MEGDAQQCNTLLKIFNMNCTQYRIFPAQRDLIKKTLFMNFRVKCHDWLPWLTGNYHSPLRNSKVSEIFSVPKLLPAVKFHLILSLVSTHSFTSWWYVLLQMREYPAQMILNRARVFFASPPSLPNCQNSVTNETLIAAFSMLLEHKE